MRPVLFTCLCTLLLAACSKDVPHIKPATQRGEGTPAIHTIAPWDGVLNSRQNRLAAIVYNGGVAAGDLFLAWSGGGSGGDCLRSESKITRLDPGESIFDCAGAALLVDKEKTVFVLTLRDQDGTVIESRSVTLTRDAHPASKPLLSVTQTNGDWTISWTNTTSLASMEILFLLRGTAVARSFAPSGEVHLPGSLLRPGDRLVVQVWSATGEHSTSELDIP